MTTAVIIGYVSLFAVAIQTGIIMIEFIREALANRRPEQIYMDAVVEGSVSRLRPKLMTVATTVLGLLPIMLTSGSGMDIAKPIATPTFGGMISSTIYVLFLIPCLFAIGDDIRLRARWSARPASLALIVAVAFAGMGCTQKGVASLTELHRQRSGALDVVLLSTRDGLRHGRDTLTIEFRSANGGNLVDVGTVSGSATMSMAGTPMIGGLGISRTDVPGRYSGAAELSMAGTWRLTVQWDGQAGQGSAAFSSGVQ
jgi:hypothetical protein